MTVESSNHFTELGVEARPFGPPLVGALLRVPWQAVQQHMLERLHEHGFDDLEPAHLTVFNYPGPQGLRPSELAARLGISKQALNYLLGQLERLGYLERRPDPDDQRSKRIALTRRGIATGLAMRDAVREIEAEWAEGLGARRFAELRRLLVDLDRLVTTRPTTTG
jgi:DNA-binding MarR family transcriptional regulator